jgi:hypothetical protein
LTNLDFFLELYPRKLSTACSTLDWIRVAAGALLDGEGSEITLVDASSTLEGGPFIEKVDSALPYILSRFDLDRGRKEDGSLPLPESVWMTETEIILQVSTHSHVVRFC